MTTAPQAGIGRVPREQTVELGGSSFLLRQMFDQDLEWWVSLQTRCARWKAQFLINPELIPQITVEDLQSMRIAGASLLVKALDCSFTAAQDYLERRPEDVQHVLQQQDGLNGILQVMHHIFGQDTFAQEWDKLQAQIRLEH